MNIISDIHGEVNNGHYIIFGECQGRKVMYKPITAKGNTSNESWVYTDTGKILEGSKLLTDGGYVI